MILSIFIRFNLVWPGTEIPLLETFFPMGAPGGVMTPEFYLAFLTMHGTIMVFFVLTTAPQGGFGNYFLPIQIGADDMAFPILNMLSFWLTFVALVVLLSAFFVTGGAPISGWTAYPPLSALGEIAGPGLGTGQTLWVLSIAIFCVAALLGALNFITTTIDMRTEGMTLMRMPLTVWSWFVTAILGLLAFGVLLAAGILLLMDRSAGTSFFIPGGLVVSDQIIDHKGDLPCSGSICSGSSAIPRSISPFFPVWESLPSFSPPSHANRFSDTGPWSTHCLALAYWALWCGDTICS